MASCACNRSCDEYNIPTDEPILYEMQESVTFISSDDSTTLFTLLKGCVVSVTETNNPTMYQLIRGDMLDDNETYMDVLIDFGRLNDTTLVRGYIPFDTLKRQKRLR
jgi:hypothetical protein